MEELIQSFSISRVSKAGARFDYEKARWINQQHLRKRSSDELLPLVRPLWEARAGTPAPSDSILKPLIELARERAQTLPEIVDVVAFYYRRPLFPLSKALESKLSEAVLAQAESLPELFQRISSWRRDEIEAALKAWAKSLKVPLGQVLLTVRLAVTGEDAGPALYAVLEILGRDEVQNRWQLFLEAYGVPGGV